MIRVFSALVLCWLAVSTQSASALPNVPTGIGEPAPSVEEDSFEQAVAAYRSGDYQTAETLWRDLLEQPAVDRAAVLYNLGNTAWRKQQPLEAAAWYTACIRLEPRHADAWANLEFVRAEADVEPADRGDLSSTLKRLLFTWTRAESEWLAIGFIALFALALGFEAVRGGALHRRLAFGAGLLLLLGLAPWLAHFARGDAPSLLVVSTGGAAVRSEPKDSATMVGQFAAGSEVTLVDAFPGWVRARDGESEGWLEEDLVRLITPPFDLEGAGALIAGPAD